MGATAIDLFAGAGGFSTGARKAGLKVVWAGNHWAEAVACHQANHPETQHAIEDLVRVNWTRVPRHDVLLASPCCQGHSQARGKDKPHHDEKRATAWAVIDALEVHRPPLAIIENVEEFATKWVMFPAWMHALKLLGYHAEAHLLNAADFGVPQARERVFVVASRRRPVRIVAPRRAHVAARNIIQWDAPGWNSIHDRKRPLAPRTMQCIENGWKRYGERFLVPYYGNEYHGRSLDKPLGTIRTKDAFGIVDGDRFRIMNLTEYRLAMGFPDDYLLPTNKEDALMMLGNAVCPDVAAEVIAQAIRQV